MKCVFFGPNLMSGIGQVTHTLSKLVYGDYIEFGQKITKMYDVGFCFIIPVPEMIEMMKVYSKSCKRGVVYMTVCETERVHDSYARLFELSDTFYTPSDYASAILKRQFPEKNFPVLRHYASPNVYTFRHVLPELEGKYVFYHIGNIIDQRKNIHKIIESFLRLNLKDSVLLLKATCNRPIEKKFPNVIILEGLMSHEELEGIHAVGDCYVSFSHSEGAGMGAIEAAMRNKPVILPEYGAGKEYIDTEYIIPCKRKKVGVFDFMYEPDMEWGDPDFEYLQKFMKDVYDKKLRCTPHPLTHSIMASVPIALTQILADKKC